MPVSECGLDALLLMLDRFGWKTKTKTQQLSLFFILLISHDLRQQVCVCVHTFSVSFCRRMCLCAHDRRHNRDGTTKLKWYTASNGVGNLMKNVPIEPEWFVGVSEQRNFLM